LSNRGTAISRGLTKREYLAGLAMQGILANPESPPTRSAAQNAIAMADELLKQLDSK